MEINKFIESKVLRCAFALSLGSFALTGCGPEVIPNQPAEVVDREYHESWVQFMYTGKTVMPIVHPEQFHLDVRQCGRYDEEEADQYGCVTAHVDVDEETYNTHNVGSEIIFHED